jgi:hypothetical protein
MIKQLEDEGRDVQAILAQTEGVPDLLAFPLVSPLLLSEIVS